MDRILVVDDEELVLDITSRIIERIGFKPILANSFKEAIDIFEKEKFGVLLLDMNLGDTFLDGCVLCSRIKSIDSSIVAIAMSGYFSQLDLKYVLCVGFTDFLIKPVGIKETQSAVKCAFERRNHWIEINN